MSGKVEAQVVFAFLEREHLNAGAEAGEFCAGRHASVVQGLALVDIVGALAPEVDFLAGHPVNFAHHGEVACKEAMVAHGAVHKVEREGDGSQIEAVAEGNVVGVFAGEVLNHVDRVNRLPTAVLGGPHEVIGIHVVGTCAEGTLTHLRRELVVFAQGVTHARAKGIRGDVGAEAREIIDINGGEVVFKSADADNLFTAREAPAVFRVSKVQPVGSVEVTHVLVWLVEALAVRVGEVLANLSVKADVEKLAFETGFGIYARAVVVEALVIAACFEAKGIEFMRLRRESGAGEE